MDVKSIVAQMSVEEKASLCSGLNFWETKPLERLGVASIMVADGPHGLRKQGSETDSVGVAESVPATCFPPAVLSACSFDRDLLREVGAAIGDEALAQGVSVVLGPGVNIKRSPLCGRNFEYFSEDPYLAGEMAAEFIKGVQSRGVGTSIKHYAANNQETRRFTTDAKIDERTLREIYFPAFEKAVKEAKPATVMCSYNRVNGVYASENHRLLTKILRDEWGFDGVVVSDWGAVNDRVMSLIAGLELQMPGGDDYNDKKIVDAVSSGELGEEILDQAAERLLELVVRYGNKGAADAKFDKEKHDKLARRVAAESVVMLKNDGILPLKSGAKIAFIGEFAEKPRYQGGGSSLVNPIKMTTALEAAAECANVTYCKGYVSEKCDDSDPVLETEAVALAKTSDVCVIFAGLPNSYECEGFDREHMRLPLGQLKLLEAVAAANPNVVVVLYNGSPVEMSWDHNAGAVLEAYLGGQAGGGAVADILFGAANPCGKLAESFPIKLSDNPSYLFYIGEGDAAEYREGVFVGYRYYDAKEMEVRYPFGHGLSYTTFDYSNLSLSAASVKDTERVTVSVDVTNTGQMAGKEIVQLYIGPKNKDDRVIRPLMELKGFDKVHLQPGETKTVTFKLDKRSFAFYHTGLSDWHVLTGAYGLYVGRSSRDIVLEGVVNVTSTVKIPLMADINTAIRDIVRMEGGEAFIRGFLEKIPYQFTGQTDDPEPGSIGFMFAKMLPDMVMRSFANVVHSSLNLEHFQAMLDEHLNK